MTVINSLNTFDPETAENNPDIEKQWAVVALNYAETYMRLLKNFGPSNMKFSSFDEEIYQDFRACFPKFNVEIISIEELKSEKAKEAWRPWMMKYENRIDMFNFASLLRIKASEDYSQNNSVLATRIQFIAIELARNREGLNSNVKFSD